MATVRRPETRAKAPALLLDAARTVFAEKGWRGATTKEIAVRAGVSEVLIFRYYGSKAELVTRAVYEPITGFLEDFTRRWEQDPTDRARSDNDLIGEYVRALLGLVNSNRALFLALLQALLDPQDDIDLTGLRASLAQLLQVVSDDAGIFLKERGHRATNPDILVRASLFLITSTAAFLPATYAADAPSPSEKQVVAELTAFMVAGIRANPEPPAGPLSPK